MAKRVIVLDTSILCCWLQVPSKETAGTGAAKWDYEKVEKTITSELSQQGCTLVLPISALIEAGNHIANAPSRRYECAQALAGHLIKAIDAKSPWAAFTEQSALWEAANVRELANELPELAARKLSIADATINNVAEYYARAGYQVRLLTGDKGLADHHSTYSRKPSRRSVKIVN